MANFCNYLEEALLAHVLKNTAYTSPTTVYAALVSSDANDAEVEAGIRTNEIDGYDGNRPAIAWGTIAQSGDGKATVANASAAVVFENMPSCTVRYIVICDSATKGGANYLIWARLGTDKSVALGDKVEIPIGDLVVDLD